LFRLHFAVQGVYVEVVRLDNISVRFGERTVLRDVSLTVQQGERIALVGPSGAGKSTLLGVINGTVSVDGGTIRLLGQDLRCVTQRERRARHASVGTVYQDLCLIDNLRVVHNVNAGHLGRWSTLRSLLSLLWPLDRAQAHEALAQVGIAEKMYEATGTLSGGQRQRVAIARILVQDPAIVLADEPISSLDPERSTEAMDLLRALNQEFGKTMIVSCHTVQFIRSHFTRVVGIKDGALHFDCSTSDLPEGALTGLYSSRPPPAHSHSIPSPREAPRGAS
jgi:phosphonate transport system ATP-binding protein